MQILSNALPGFRDLRGPIIAGYMWLFASWLIVRPDLDTKPSSQIGGALWDLRHHVGHIGVAIAVSVAAYLIGSISHEISRALRSGWNEVAEKVAPRAIQFAETRLANRQILDDLLRSREISREFLRTHSTAEQAEQLLGELDVRFRQASAEAQRELSLPATVLVGEKGQEQLFAEVDRLRAEGELRVAVVPPLLALLIVLATMQSRFWLLGIPPIAVLFVQGVRRETDSRKLIADAVDSGLVESGASTKYTAWVDGLQAKLERSSSGPFGEPLSDAHLEAELAERHPELSDALD
jgi:hypothetical protein